MWHHVRPLFSKLKSAIIFPSHKVCTEGVDRLSCAWNSLKQGKNSKLCCFSATWAFRSHSWSVATWTTDIILKTGFEFCANASLTRSFPETWATTTRSLPLFHKCKANVVANGIVQLRYQRITVSYCDKAWIRSTRNGAGLPPRFCF